MQNLMRISIPSQRFHVTLARILGVRQLADVSLKFSRSDSIAISERVILRIQALSSFNVLYRGGLHNLGNDVIPDMFENF